MKKIFLILFLTISTLGYSEFLLTANINTNSYYSKYAEYSGTSDLYSSIALTTSFTLYNYGVGATVRFTENTYDFSFNLVYLVPLKNNLYYSFNGGILTKYYIGYDSDTYDKGLFLDNSFYYRFLDTFIIGANISYVNYYQLVYKGIDLIDFKKNETSAGIKIGVLL